MSAVAEEAAFVNKVAHPEEHYCGKEDRGLRPRENEVTGNLEDDILEGLVNTFLGHMYASRGASDPTHSDEEHNQCN